jgi:hypothetical protein
MSFMVRDGWSCQFLEADLKTPSLGSWPSRTRIRLGNWRNEEERSASGDRHAPNQGLDTGRLLSSLYRQSGLPANQSQRRLRTSSNMRSNLFEWYEWGILPLHILLPVDHVQELLRVNTESLAQIVDAQHASGAHGRDVSREFGDFGHGTSLAAL